MSNNNNVVKALIGALVIAIGLWFVQGAFAKQEDKVYWCHTEPNGNQQTLHLPLQALQNAGHMDASGNPLHAGDHAGQCVEPTVTPTNVPTATPTVFEQEPTPTPTEEVTPTPEVTRMPTTTPTPTQGANRLGSDLRNDTTGTPSCPNLTPQRVRDIWLEDDASGNNTLVLRWGTSESYDRVHIVYGFAPHDMRYSLLNTEDDGIEAIGGLDNDTHYWFAVQSVNGCAVAEPSDWIDPRP